MKLAITAGAVLVGIILTVLTLATPTINAYSSCLARSSDSFKKVAIWAKSQYWDKEKTCIASKQIIDDTGACYSRANSKSIIPPRIIFMIANILRPGENSGDATNTVIEMHNTSCMNFPETLTK